MDPIELVNQLNGLYTNAFTQLITITAIIIGWVGVIVPIILQGLQKQSINNEKKALETQLMEKMSNYKMEAQQQIDSHLAKESENLKISFDCEFNRLKGMSFFLQANVFENDKAYDIASLSYIASMIYFLEGNDEESYQSSFNNFTKIILPKLTIKDLEDEELIELRYKELISLLEKRDENGRYSHNIRDLKKLMSKIKKTNPDIGKL